ncbi:MAG: ABC transporter permease [Waddliaceae bacterium]
MTAYILRRLLLLPLTLFFIILVTFLIINLAPGDPTTIMDISPTGAGGFSEHRGVSTGVDDRYLQFREHYGLTLPIFLNFWTFTSQDKVEEMLFKLSHRDEEDLTAKEFNTLRVAMGDRSPYVMPKILSIMENPDTNEKMRRMAIIFFIRGATQFAILGSDLNEVQRAYNRKIAADNQFLKRQTPLPFDTSDEIEKKIHALKIWYQENKGLYQYEPTAMKSVKIAFQSRLIRYFSRVVTLDFGTMRNDPNQTVIYEVSKRFKYSLTLSVIPLIITFFLCLFFGLIMAYNQNFWPDYSLNLLFLVLYAIPIFVVAPFLIEKIALGNTFPFTNVPIPISGFTSPEPIYEQLNTSQRLVDTLKHITLPLIAIMYGTLAASTRLSRTAILEVLRKSYVRTAHAKGLSKTVIMVKHVGRNAAITIVTALASSLGVVLGGSLIVETIFGIDGFGKFFYDAVLNRDYNVIMFSTIAGSFLTLVGYLLADITYTILDPRITLE